MGNFMLKLAINLHGPRLVTLSKKPRVGTHLIVNVPDAGTAWEIHILENYPEKNVYPMFSCILSDSLLRSLMDSCKAKKY